MSHETSPAYDDIQDKMNAECKAAWLAAPEGFIEEAASLGMKVDIEDHTGMAMEYDENLSKVHCPGHTPSFHIPDMAETLDTQVDRLIEKYGAENETLIRAITADLKVPMQQEIEKNRALMLGRVAMYLVKSESNNILARVHQLLHSIPRLAAITGFDSMRKSAKACGVSPEWMRRGRDRFCNELGLPIPAEGRKSDIAKAKYQTAATKHHWRHQKFVAVQQPNQTPCPTLIHPTIQPKILPHLVAA